MVAATAAVAVVAGTAAVAVADSLAVATVCIVAFVVVVADHQRFPADIRRCFVVAALPRRTCRFDSYLAMAAVEKSVQVVGRVVEIQPELQSLAAQTGTLRAHQTGSDR